VLAVGLSGLAVAAAVPTRRAGPLLTGVAALAAAAVMLTTALRIRAVERRWPETREQLIQRASERLAATLASAVDLAHSLAERAAAIEADSRADAFTQVQSVVGDGAPEHGVVVLDELGRPWAWSGTHRVGPGLGGGLLAARMTPFYVLLEARRQAGMRSSVSQVVLAAGGAIPNPERTLAARFVEETGVGLEFYRPGAAPIEPDIFDYCIPACEAVPGELPPDTLFSVRAVPPVQGAFKLELVERGGRLGAQLALAVLLLLVCFGGAMGRWVGVFGVMGLLVLTPAGQLVGLGPLFSSATYFLETLGPLTSSAGALLLGAAVLLLALLPLAPRGTRARVPRLASAGILVLAAPWVMWLLSRGITPPATGLSIGHWLGWQVPLTMVGAALGMAASLLLGGAVGRESPPWTVWLVSAGALLVGVVGLVAWQPAGDWPAWYGLMWVPLMLAAVWPTGRAQRLVMVGVAAGTAAAVLTWGAAVHGRLLLAERDAERLRGGDPVAIGFLDRFSVALEEDDPPLSAAALYAAWRRSPLSGDNYPAVLATWSPGGQRMAWLQLAELGLGPTVFEMLADTARSLGEPLLRSYELHPGVRYLSATPHPDGSVVTVGVAPRSQLIRPVRLARFLRGELRVEAPYEMFTAEPVAEGAPPEGVGWRRDAWEVRTTRPLDMPQGMRHLHISVPLRDPSQLLVRGALFVVLDVALLALLALAAAAMRGGLDRRTLMPGALRLASYRMRLTLALAAFFVIPTLGFAAWSIGRLQADAARSRDLLIQQTLSDAARTAERYGGLPPEEIESGLSELAARLNADLLWYEGGVLAEATTTVLVELGLIDTYLAPRTFRALTMEDEPELTTDDLIGGHPTRVGYRTLGGAPDAVPVLAAPRLVDVGNIRREQEDLAFGLLLVTLLGLGGAAGLATLAARSLARPVQSLRAAAVAVGRGDSPPPFEPNVPAEFVSVVDAFERMAADVEASQSALDAARRRTATVLRNVATGVVALDRTMLVTIANPRAGELLGATLEPGTPIAAATAPDWLPVWEWVLDFMRHGHELGSREFSVGARRIRGQVAALQTDPRGCVVALDDTTELTHAVRVLAWGELARQIAHEIKNPLTPIRLGVQHLQRARRHGRADFDATLEQTSQQILAEIERLDAIARAFSRFGAPTTEAAPLVAADLTAIAVEAAALYSLGGDTVITVEEDGPVSGMVRPGEVKEVLVNLIENARDANALNVRIAVRTVDGAAEVEVRDDGGGITDEHMIHIFEPQFSTTSSGTGLGLAICRRLVESWGGTIDVDSVAGEGTTVRVRVPAAAGA
jgi:signal transduction histidine kinase